MVMSASNLDQSINSNSASSGAITDNPSTGEVLSNSEVVSTANIEEVLETNMVISSKNTDFTTDVRNEDVSSSDIAVDNSLISESTNVNSVENVDRENSFTNDISSNVNIDTVFTDENANANFNSSPTSEVTFQICILIIKCRRKYLCEKIYLSNLFYQ